MVTADGDERRPALRRRGTGRRQLAPRLAELAAELAKHVRRARRLAPAVHLAQPAPLVKAAAQLLRG